MARPPDPGASARRLALWAASLALPLLLGALLLPGVVRWLRAAPGAAAPAEGARGEPREAPPRPEAPTPGQIEAAREAQEALARAQQGWTRAETFAPRAPRRDASGDLLSPFEGFGVSVESTPAGATVAVGGRELGQTPLLASVPCEPGAVLELTLSLGGHQVHRQPLRCRADALQHLAVPLKRKGP